MRFLAIWGGLTGAVLVPIVVAMASPLLAWREPVYIAAGFFGTLALGLLLVQPLLAASWLPGLARRRSRLIHRWLGTGLLVSILLHVFGLWLTSPPDVIDAFLFRSPTAFSPWGVIALWCGIAVFVSALMRRRGQRRPERWRALHLALALVLIGSTVIHAMLVEGTMEPVSKTVQCVLVVLVALAVVGSRYNWFRSGAE